MKKQQVLTYSITCASSPVRQIRGAGELAGAQRARGEPSLSVWPAKHAIARSAKGLRQQTRSHVQARPPLSQYNLPDDGYAANHLRPPQEPVETDGLCDDPGAVSKVAIRDTEPKLHRIIDWCRHEKVLVGEFRKPRFTRKRRPG
jgi:hypothetical protein